MKKIAICLIIFLFSFVVTAQTAENETKTGVNSGPVASEDDVSEAEVAPSKFYVQPALGVGTGMSIFRTNAALDIDFLLKQSKGARGYMGFDIDLRYMTIVWDGDVELALQLNTVIDIDVNNDPRMKSVSFWGSAGLLLYFDKNDDDYKSWGGYSLVLRPAWGIGTDLVFRNGMILKIGIDGFRGKYPDLTLAVGYRF